MTFGSVSTRRCLTVAALRRDRPARRVAARVGARRLGRGPGTVALGATEALAAECAVVKPQSAFYERFGSRGVAVLERVIATARDVGALVLLDVKRGDIGSTSEAYAEAYLDPRARWPPTPSPSARSSASARSTPSSTRPASTRAASSCWPVPPTRRPPRCRPRGPTTAVPSPAPSSTTCAASTPAPAARLLRSRRRGDRRRDGRGLRGQRPAAGPRYGAQGGTAADLPRIFGAALPAVLPSSSRELLRAGPDPAAMREAARRTNDELRAVIG